MKGDRFITYFCELVDKEGMEDVTLSISKEKTINGDEPFRSLNFICKNDKYRSEIFKPLYDPPTILQHEWLSGCSSQELKKVEFDIDSEQVLCLFRLIYRHKESRNRVKTIYLHFNFAESTVDGWLDGLKHNTRGEITEFNFTDKKYEGNYLFSVPSQYAGRIYELL